MKTYEDALKEFREINAEHERRMRRIDQVGALMCLLAGLALPLTFIVKLLYESIFK